jgi:NitT/TauT family transport system permease protein
MAKGLEAREETGTLAGLPSGIRTGQRPWGAPGLDAVFRFALPIVVVAAFLLIWQFLPKAVGLHKYELPNLSDTLQGLHDDWSIIGTSLLVTLQDAVAGFIIGNGLAVLGATVFIYSQSMERAFYPVAILIQTIPIIVYAPLFVIFFLRIPVLGNDAQATSVVAVAVLITFFPTLVNMAVGLKTIDPQVYELMRLLNASKTQIFLKLRFPSAIPFLFSSLKITSTLAFVGAIVGEYMVNGGFNPIGQALNGIGLSNVLGFPTAPLNATGIGGQYQTFYSELDKPGIFASVFAVSLLSMVFFGLMVLLERVFVPWQKKQ